MTALRRSGSFVAFTWQGEILDPRDAAFAEALRSRRFRTIENAASEEVSVGWCTPVDPTGETFSVEDLDGGAGTWLRFRMDKKTMPKEWLRTHLDAAANARGKRLSARERRELRDSLAESMLPRVLPTITKVDALLFHERRTVLLFATSKAAREAFGKLFFESLGVALERNNPLQAGLHAGLTDEQRHTLERLEPIRWPSNRKAPGGAA